MGSPRQAGNSRRVIRRALATAFLILVTVLMWSDAVVDWWQSLLAWLLETNESATQSVLDVRPSGDADLHILVWAMVAWAMAVSFVNRRWRVLMFVAFWSALVETLQPLFTEIRARQVLDYVGNLVGVTLVAIGFLLIDGVRSRRGQPNSPAR